MRMKLHSFRTMSWRMFTFSALQMSGRRRGTREILKNIFLCQMISLSFYTSSEITMIKIAIYAISKTFYLPLLNIHRITFVGGIHAEDPSSTTTNEFLSITLFKFIEHVCCPTHTYLVLWCYPRPFAHKFICFQ